MATFVRATVGGGGYGPPDHTARASSGAAIVASYDKDAAGLHTLDQGYQHDDSWGYRRFLLQAATR
jgi:hypothetical protein